MTPGRVSWYAVLGLLALLLGISLAVRQWRPATPAALRPEPAPQDDGASPTGSDAVIEDALRQAGAERDSVVEKSRWQEEIRGVDVASLDPKRTELFLRFANAERCTCGCGYTLAGCRATDMSCEVSMSRVRALLDSVIARSLTSAAGIRERPRASHR